MSRGPDDGDGETRQTALPPSSGDEQATRAVSAEAGIIAELRAVLTDGARKSLPLYALADQITVGRGSGCDWRLEDDSLSRTHAQFKWTGAELTVEDLGSANGTRVGSKPARVAVKVRPGEQVHIGTVVVTLEPRAVDADGQSTRLVNAPPVSPSDDTTPPPGNRFPNLPGLATVVRPPQATGRVALNAQVFRPPREAARPDEPTRPWDPRAALVRSRDKAFEGDVMAAMGEAWRTNRRPFVLGGAALWIGLLLGVWWLHDRTAVDDEPVAALPAPVPAPKVSPLLPPGAPPPPAPGLPAATPPASADEADAELAAAIAAYDQGRLAESLTSFRRLAADGKNDGARFMVELLEKIAPPGGAP